MKISKKIVVIILVFTSINSIAQNSEFENFLRGGVDDANILLGYYMKPVLRGMGYGFNNGWYNTAKPHETLGFDLTISFKADIVPVVDQSFIFNNSDYSNTRLQSGATSASLPTLMGNDSNIILENYAEGSDIDPNLPPGEVVVGSYPAPDGIADDIQAYTFNQIAVPSPIIQVGVGIIKGTEVKVRWLPEVSQENIRFKYFGIGGLHSISQWIPVIKERKFLDISAFVGWTTISADYAIPTDNSISGSNQRAVYDVKTITYQLIASANVSVITGYIGIGMDTFKTSFKLNGTYDVYPGVVPELVDPIDLSESGEGGFRTTFGARLKLAIITLHADYTIREYNTLNVGLGFSFR